MFVPHDLISVHFLVELTQLKWTERLLRSEFWAQQATLLITYSDICL